MSPELFEEMERLAKEIDLCQQAYINAVANNYGVMPALLALASVIWEAKELMEHTGGLPKNDRNVN